MTTAKNDSTKSSRVDSDGKDLTVSRTNDLSSKSLFQHKNGRMEYVKNILDKPPQGYIRGCKNNHNGDMFFLAIDEDWLRQVAAVHHLKIVQEGTLEQWL